VIEPSVEKAVEVIYVDLKVGEVGAKASVGGSPAGAGLQIPGREASASEGLHSHNFDPLANSFTFAVNQWIYVSGSCMM
jgi:hypothetical protein